MLTRRQVAIITKLNKGKGPNATNAQPFNSYPLRTGIKEITMTSISNFESNVYSEETYNVTESDYNEVMQMMADEQSGFEGYAEWSLSLDSPVVNESENFIATADGRVHHKPQPKSNGRIGGIEI